MAVEVPGMVSAELDDRDEQVLDVMREEERANPYLIRQETGLGKGELNTSLSRLTDYNYLRKVTRGLYEFVEDPRNED